nr:NADH-dependent butanol dehydrogenase A [Sporomusa silvacetica DSM 10669]
MVYGGGSIKKTGLYDKVSQEIKKMGLELLELSGVDPNPRHVTVNQGAEICKKEQIDVLLAVGGGSVIDATKSLIYMAAGDICNNNIRRSFTGKVF